VGISGSPCFTSCHALLRLPKHLVIGLDHVVLLGFSSFLGYMTGASGLWDIGYGKYYLLSGALARPRFAMSSAFGPKTR
jgi:hypothetical protein